MLPFEFFKQQVIVDTFLFLRPGEGSVLLTKRHTDRADLGLSCLYIGVCSNVHINAFNDPLWLQFFHNIGKVTHILYTGQSQEQLTVRKVACNV